RHDMYMREPVSSRVVLLATGAYSGQTRANCRFQPWGAHVRLSQPRCVRHEFGRGSNRCRFLLLDSRSVASVWCSLRNSIFGGAGSSGQGCRPHLTSHPLDASTHTLTCEDDSNHAQHGPARIEEDHRGRPRPALVIPEVEIEAVETVIDPSLETLASRKSRH